MKIMQMCMCSCVFFSTSSSGALIWLVIFAINTESDSHGFFLGIIGLTYDDWIAAKYTCPYEMSSKGCFN